MLDDVICTHLVLASSKLVLQKRYQKAKWGSESQTWFVPPLIRTELNILCQFRLSRPTLKSETDNHDNDNINDDNDNISDDNDGNDDSNSHDNDYATAKAAHPFRSDEYHF